jgi:hypothetical protein
MLVILRYLFLSGYLCAVTINKNKRHEDCVILLSLGHSRNGKEALPYSC